MAFVEYDFYKNLYADSVDETAFNRLCWSAEKVVRDATTGVDGICKLDRAFPTIPYDADTVKRCICDVINVMNQVDLAEQKAQSGQIVASKSAGNESISYVVGAGVVGQAMNSKSEQSKLYMDIVNHYLRGVKDNNGVNLLYSGIYPYVIRY